ncbi:MAG: class I SAM-dependent methyltransferase [Candidatus Sericytochromatia bacterium]|nr:class I SAM-dependent methyltransferase [Candidatus Sericytochromatia bacterium]
MVKDMRRREFLQLAAFFAAAVALDAACPGVVRAQLAAGRASPPTALPASDAQNVDAIGHASNFTAIYQDPQLKAAFFQFLLHVFHLFPEEKFHKLLADVTLAGRSDKDIYRVAQSRLGEIKPLLADVRYALPALAQQKAEMARQTMDLLGSGRKINGYMEIGTTGRYISKFRASVELTGEVVLLHTDAPTYSPADIVERAQLGKLGRYVSLNGYAPVPASQVADRSVDLISNFIGFHHSPPARRDAFVASLHRVLRPGGRMIVRDHDVTTPQMNRMVALAHDVFNLGLGTAWAVNQAEIRNWTSLAQLTAYVETCGFKRTPKTLYQPGDPTKNALIEFIRV